MATFLDLMLLERFAVIFSMLLVFVFVLGALRSTKALGNNAGIHALIAIILAIFVLFFPNIGKFIATVAPWFVVMFIFIVFVLVAVKLFGVTDVDIANVMRSKRAITTWIILLSVAIVLIAGSNVWGGQFLAYTATNNTTYISGNASTATGSVPTNVGATIFHPKVLGLMVVLLIAVFAVILLAGKTTIE